MTDVEQLHANVSAVIPMLAFEYRRHEATWRASRGLGWSAKEIAWLNDEGRDGWNLVDRSVTIASDHKSADGAYILCHTYTSTPVAPEAAA